MSERYGIPKILLFSQHDGQSLMEVVIAMAIFSLIAASLVSLILGSLALTNEGGLVTQADMLAQEGVEAVKAIKNRAWNEVIFEQSAIERVGNDWRFVGEGTSEQLGRFSRTIQFFPVYRDNLGQIVEAGSEGASLDLESKNMTVLVSWQSARGTTNTVQKKLLFTNWESNRWAQSDWSGGGEQDLVGEANKYLSDDGNIESTVGGVLTLKSIATSTYATTGYLISSAFFIGENGAPSLIFADWGKPVECDECDVKLQIVSAPDNAGAPGNWTPFWSGELGINEDESDFYTATTSGAIIHLDHNNDRWFRYKIVLSGTETYTPIVDEIRFDYRR